MGLGARVLAHRGIKPLCVLLAFLPLAQWGVGVWGNSLGPNPAEALIRSSGDWSLRFLCVALAITPLRWWTGWAAWARLRRLWGLVAFFYVCLHLCAYTWLDQGGDLPAVLADVWQRPFIAWGAFAWLILLALALTSFNQAVRWLGGARWRALHRGVYGVAVLALLHFHGMRAGKNDFTEVWVYGAVLMGLLLFRLKIYKKNA